MTPTGLDTKRLVQMVGYCLCAGIAAGFTAWGAGGSVRSSVAAGAAAVALAAGGYWSTSPKHGALVDAAKEAQSAAQDGGDNQP